MELLLNALSVAGFLEKMDGERLAVARAVGTDVSSVKRWLTSAYVSSEGDTLYDAIQSNEAYREIYAPETIHHRYVYDDVPTGLVPMVSLGKLLGVDTPSWTSSSSSLTSSAAGTSEPTGELPRPSDWRAWGGRVCSGLSVRGTYCKRGQAGGS